MALSDKKIIEEMKAENIIISPFKKENLGTSSYDVSLGEYFFREQKPKHYHNIYNIYDKIHTTMFGAQKHKKLLWLKRFFKNLSFVFPVLNQEIR